MSITTDEIRENLIFAANIMRRLPPVKVQGYICSWPKCCMDEDDYKNEKEIWMMPLPEEITAMENILGWLEYINYETRRIVWLRSCGMGWKLMSAKTHQSRSNLIRIYNRGLKDIAEVLNKPENLKKSTFLVKAYRVMN